MDFNLTGPDALPWRKAYKLLIGAVVPRPIAWVSTVSEGGQYNLAPFSFFNAVSANPPHLVFSPMIRSTDGRTKDTLNNIRHAREFVVNVVTEDLAEAMNITSGEYQASVDEFELAGLTPAPSAAIRAPRVAESPVNFECWLADLLPLGEPGALGTATLVIGKVAHIHVDDSVLFDGDKIDLEKLKPVGRLAGTSYTRVTDLFDMVRPPSQVGEQS